MGERIDGLAERSLSLTQTVARILSVIGALERRFGLADLEKEERLIVYFLVDQLAEGREVRLADVAGSGVCSRPSAYRHVSNLVAKRVIQVHGKTQLTLNLAPRLADYEKAFKAAITKLSKAPKVNRP